MREIYLKRRDFELKFNPGRASKAMLPLMNPELFINDNMTTHTFPEGFQKNVPEKVSFECSLLLTNPTHSGLWLLMNEETSTISLPGGYITEEDWIYASQNPYYVIYSTIIHALINAHPILSKNAECDPLAQISNAPTLAELFDTLQYVIGQYSLDVNPHSGKDLLYYQYHLSPKTVMPRGLENEELDFRALPMRIFVLKEVMHPGNDVPAFINYDWDHMIWYPKREHQMNYKTTSNRRVFFRSQYKNDIRLTAEGIICLDHIFKDENRFGKIDIY